MSSSRLDRVLVVGGGFSGLSAAIMLAKAGVTVELIERSTEWTMDGAGISIGPPSLRALHRIGVLDRFIEHGYAGDGQSVRAPDGTQIGSWQTPRLASPDHPGTGAIMRPLLGRILVDEMAAAGVTARLGTTIADVTDDHAGVDIRFSDDTTGRYDLVVAADGLYSSMRERLFPDAPRPAFSGQGAWRAVVPRPDEVTSTVVWVGAPAKVGVNPISQAEMYLFVNEAKDRNDRVADAELLPRLRKLIEPLTDPVMLGVKASLGEDSLVLYRPMDAVLLPLPWHRGRVVLIGDAAHATTPHLQAGAGIGLEDAIVLAEEFTAAHDSVEAGLTAFEERRFERCRMVVENSAELGRLEASAGSEREFVELQTESYRLLAEPI